jgi:tetratricopeptide (TPR) repeat protein
MKKLKSLVLSLVFVMFLSGAAMCATAADYVNAGMKFYKAGDYKKAISFFTAAVKLEKNPKYYKAIGACYQKMGDTASAQKYFNYSAKLAGGGAATGTAQAKNKSVNISVFGGFTTVAMGKFNDMINNFTGTGITKGLMGPAFNIGAGAGFAVIPGLYIGPRFEYIGASAVTTGGTDSLLYEISLVPLLAGATYTLSLEGAPVDLSGLLYLGYGFWGLYKHI